ncbi:MAG: hypothetical protein AB7G75_12045 [Candidatus Binatia bacterium]
MWSRVTPLRFVFILFPFCLVASPARAVSVTEVTFAQLVAQSEVIAVGTVTDIREEWNETQRAAFTLVTFADLTVIKGNPGESMTLEFLGGHTPEGLIMTIPGVPQFSVGEKAVVFCAGNKRDFCPLVGIWQGVLRVARNPQSGEETVSDNFRIPIVDIQGGKFVKLVPGKADQRPLSLSDLIQAVEQELRSSAAQS